MHFHFYKRSTDYASEMNITFKLLPNISIEISKEIQYDFSLTIIRVEWLFWSQCIYWNNKCKICTSSSKNV